MQRVEQQHALGCRQLTRCEQQVAVLRLQQHAALLARAPTLWPPAAAGRLCRWFGRRAGLLQPRCKLQASQCSGQACHSRADSRGHFPVQRQERCHVSLLLLLVRTLRLCGSARLGKHPQQR